MKIKTCFTAVVCTAAATLMLASPVQAGPVPGQGTWDNPNPTIGLQARDLNGDSVTDAFYDPKLNITWLRDASVTGPIDWDTANAWANGYSFGGYSDWRLPTILDTGNPGCNYAYSGTDCGYNVQTTSGSTVYSEMASLWYDTLGNKAYYSTSGSGPQTGWGLTNSGDFLNLQFFYFWSGLNYANSSKIAWYFDADWGFQNISKYQFSAMAVRPGDVLAVPEPGTLALAALALAVLGVFRRRALRAS